jgi:hypothetical protein
VIKYIKVFGIGILVVFAFLFIVLACSNVFQNQLTTLGRIYMCIVACSNFILTTRFFMDKLCELNK